MREAITSPGGMGVNGLPISRRYSIIFVFKAIWSTQDNQETSKLNSGMVNEASRLKSFWYCLYHLMIYEFQIVLFYCA